MRQGDGDWGTRASEANTNPNMSFIVKGTVLF